MSRRTYLLAVAAALLLMVGCDGPESPQSKSEYAALQSAEYEARGMSLREPVIRQVHGFELLGVAGQNSQNVWVLLRAHAEPKYTQIPAGVYYSVSETLVERLERENRASPEVARWLRKGGV